MRSLLFVAVPLVAVVVACGQRQLAATGDPQTPYGSSRTTVIGTDASGNDVRGSTSEEVQAGDCVTVGAQCVDTSQTGAFCERQGGPSDAIVVDGKVAVTVCYPPPKDGAPTVAVDTNHDGNIDIPQNANNTTVTFAPSTDGTPVQGDITIDGTPVQGDITIDGNNVAIYGNGADKTVIDGDVTLDGNNVRLRGLTITGNLTMSKNNMAAVLVKVLGNVVVDGENDVFTASDVFGSLTVSKNNVVLVQNRAQGSFSAAGNNPDCAANQAFTDANHDDNVQQSEVGADLTCGG